jgi:integrase
LPWNPAHRDIQSPLQGVLRAHPLSVQKAAALTLPVLRLLLATCDQTARGRHDRTLLLFGFVGALRCTELVALRAEDVAVIADELRPRIRRGKTDQAGQGAEVGLPRWRHVETRPVRAFEAWQAVARRKVGPLFRRISAGGGISDTALHSLAGLELAKQGEVVQGQGASPHIHINQSNTEDIGNILQTVRQSW